MWFRYIIWQRTGRGQSEPIQCASPAGITSSEWARNDAREVVRKFGIPADFLIIESDDGTIVEEWLWRGRRWIRRDPTEIGPDV